MLPKAGQVQVTETAGRLRLIRSVLEGVGRTAGRRRRRRAGVSTDACRRRRRAAAVASTARHSGRRLRRGRRQRPPRRRSAHRQTARRRQAGAGRASGRDHESDRRSRAGRQRQRSKRRNSKCTTSASPIRRRCLAVLQTLMANFSDVRLTTDPLTGKLVALARPAQHATIRATIEQMQREARQFEVIRLQFVDPQVAVTAIGKLFGDDSGAAAAGAPKVEADPLTRQLIVRGSQGQIEQIRVVALEDGRERRRRRAAKRRPIIRTCGCCRWARARCRRRWSKWKRSGRRCGRTRFGS